MYYRRFSSPKSGDLSRDILEFAGDEVVLYRLMKQEKGGDERKEIKRLPVSALFKELKETLYSERVIETPLLPEGTRYVCYKKDAGNGVLVLEQAPQTRTIKWMNQKQQGTNWKIKKFTLAFPFVVLICKISSDLINDVRVFYRNSWITSLQNELFHTNLRNIYEDNSRICLGFREGGQNFIGQVLPQKSTGNLVKWVEQIFSNLWDNCFNADIDNDEFTFSRRLDKRISTVEAWQRASQENELFPLSVRWRKTGKTIEYVIKEIGYGSWQEDHLCSLDNLLDMFYRCAPEAKPKHLPTSHSGE